MFQHHLLSFVFTCRQIRVWDVVDDHDKLTDRIKLTIDRIEKSCLRGEQSSVFAELETAEFPQVSKSGGIFVPRVFTMKQSAMSAQSQANHSKQRCFPPASHDPLKYTLEKFYELNSDAVEMLLQTDVLNDEIELPFSPGPKEHEIIHHRSNPQRSILLMGRR